MESLNGRKSNAAPFQNHTVQHLKEVYTRQKAYIVADEVGMGKTFVAAGLIEACQFKRVIYIASNGQIAAQNAKKLQEETGLTLFDAVDPLTGKNYGALRMSILDLTKLNSDERYIISLSPAVTFTGKGSPGGTTGERSFYEKAVQGECGNPNVSNSDKEKLRNAWNALEQKTIGRNKDGPFLHSFNPEKEISPLRAYFNDRFLNAYQPDLIIMDEFHRFHTLLDPKEEDPKEEDSAEYNLWGNDAVKDERCKLLLLSATPYRYKNAKALHKYGLTERDEDDDEGDDDTPFTEWKQLVDYLDKLNGREPNSSYDVKGLYDHVLCRTQRNWLTGQSENSAAPVLHAEADVDGWSRSALSHMAWLKGWKERMHGKDPQPPHLNLEYLDEAPDYEQFLAGYAGCQKDKEQKAFGEKLRDQDNRAFQLQNDVLDDSAFERLAGYYKWECLKQFAMPEGAELLLWVPPTMKRKYYALELRDFSKTLVFAHYKMSTRAIAALTSMEAERRLREHLKGQTVIDQFEIDDELARELFPDELLDKAKAASRSEALKKLETEELRGKAKEALTVFLNTTYARTVLTAWAVSNGIALTSPKELLREYCKAYYWSDMMQEYLDVAGKDFLSCIAGYFPESGGGKKVQDKELRPSVLRWKDEDRTRIHIMPDWTGTGFPCTFGERYTQDHSDRGAHDRSHAKTSMRNTGKRLEYIQSRFQSPFYPFVLAASETAREGVDLHNYCAQVIHWSVPSSDQAYTQEEGRVDRRFSLSLRWQLADIYEAYSKREPSPEQVFSVGALFAHAETFCKAVYPDEADAISAHKESGIFPMWVLPGNSCLKRHLLYLPLSTEAQEYQALKTTLRNYVTFGVPHVRDDDLRGLCPYLVRQAAESKA